MQEKYFLKSLLFLLFLHVPAIFAEANNFSITILGDSISTGAGAHEQLSFDGDTLWDIFKGKLKIDIKPSPELRKYVKDGDFSPPKYLWFSTREYTGSFEWVSNHLMRAFSATFLNSEEYSWGYLTGKALGAKSQNIVFAGENGARVSQINRQLDRVLDASSGVLSDKIFIVFSGMDLCSLSTSLITSEADYKERLLKGIKYLANNGKAASNGTEVVVLGFLGMTQLIVDESILNKKVKAFGQDMTCRQLRAQQFQPEAPLSSARHQETLLMNHIFPPNPARYCPTLFALPLLAHTSSGFFSAPEENTSGQTEKKTSSVDKYQLSPGLQTKVDELLSMVASRIRQYRQASEAAIREANLWRTSAHPQKNISFRYLDGLEKLQFEAADVTHDCFHISKKGHMKIADLVLQEIKNGPVVK